MGHSLVFFQRNAKTKGRTETTRGYGKGSDGCSPTLFRTLNILFFHVEFFMGTFYCESRLL